MRIILHGNCVIDSIFKAKNFERYRLGGIFNVANALPKNYNIVCSCAINNNEHNFDFGTKTFTQISSLPTSRAEISLKNNDYSAKVNFGACKEFKILPFDGDWHHIAYLNTLPSITNQQIKRLNGVISADVCLGNFSSFEICRIHELSENIDYLFMNEKEALSLFFNCPFKNIAKIATIIHSRDCVSILNGEKITSFIFNPEEEFYSLGSGDRFVANFIKFKNDNNSIEESAKLAYG